MQATFKAARVNKGLSQSDAAAKIGVSTTTLANWENYRSFPDVVQFQKMCEIYECSRNDIFLPDALSKSGL